MAGEKSVKGTIETLLGGYMEDGGWTWMNRFESMTRSIAGFIKPMSEVQSGMLDLAKSVGLSADGILNATNRIIAVNKSLSLSKNYGLSTKEMVEAQAKILNQVGRNIGISYSNRTIKTLNGEIIEKYRGELEPIVAAVSVFGSDNVAKFIEFFDRFGRTAGTAAEEMGALYADAAKNGVNLSKYTEAVLDNITMAQNYNFRKGVDGLKSMAMKATEVRQNMQQVAQFADRVGTVTGAVETAAKLQVLGGGFALAANPLALLHGALTDLNSLQETMLNMTKGMAYYDQEEHQVKLDPTQRMQIKAAAELAGFDAGNMIEVALSQGRREEIDRQMGNVPEMAGLDDEDLKEYIRNAGKIDEKTGLAGIVVGNEFRTLEELANSSSLRNQLNEDRLFRQYIDEAKQEGKLIEVIAKGVLGIEKSLCGGTAQYVNELAFNKSRKGVLGNPNASQWDIVNDFVKRSLTPDFYANLGNGSFAVEAVMTPIATGIAKGAVDIFNQLLETDGTVDGFFDGLMRSINTIIPDEWQLSKDIKTFLTFAKDELSPFMTNVSEFIRERGVDTGEIFGTRNEDAYKMPGEAILTADYSKIKEMIETAAREFHGGGTEAVQHAGSQPVVNVYWGYGYAQGADGQPVVPNEKNLPMPQQVQPVVVMVDGKTELPEVKVSLDGNFMMYVKAENGTDLTKIDMKGLMNDWIKDHKGEFDTYVRNVFETYSKMSNRQAVSTESPLPS